MKFIVDLGPQSYALILKRGVLSKAAQLANFTHKVLIVADDSTPREYIQTLCNQSTSAELFSYPAGEEHKSIDTWKNLLTRMAELDFGREDLLVGLGGGTTADLACFGASAYRESIPYILVPTTLYGQASACLHPKASLHMGPYKNLVALSGCPQLILMDPELLHSLSARQEASGFAELLLTALVGSRELFELLEEKKWSTDQEIERLLYLSLRYRQGLAEQDQSGNGETRLLTFGQPIAQALMEASATTETPLLYGECVALGMLPMIEARTLLRRTRSVMRKIGLPLKTPFKPELALPFIEKLKAQNRNCTPVVRVKYPGQGYLETLEEEEIHLLYAGQFLK